MACGLSAHTPRTSILQPIGTQPGERVQGGMTWRSPHRTPTVAPLATSSTSPAP